jgi:branched-chain amino acid transport system ATP-binding protein
LLDELVAGLNQDEIKKVKDLIINLNKNGITIIAIEHIMSFIKEITSRVIVMDAGKIIFKGDFKDAVENKTVKEVYLGTKNTA